MKRLIGYVIRGILLLGMLLCFGRAIHSNALLEKKNNLIHYQLEQAKTQSQVEELFRKANSSSFRGEFLALHTLGGQSFFAEHTSGTSRVSLLQILGNSHVIYEDLAAISQSSEGKCLISTGAANEIFGGTNVLGMQIFYQNERGERVGYEIQDLIPSQEPMVLVPWEKNTTKTEEAGSGDAPGTGVTEQEIFESLVLHVLDYTGEEKENICKKFTELAGISAEEASMDFSFYKNGATFFLFLLPFLITLLLTGMLLRFLLRSRRKPFWILGGLLLFCLIIVTWMHGSTVKIGLPESWIPSSWSDFTFWENKASAQIALIKKVLFTQKSLLEIFYYNQMLSTALYMVAAAFCFLFSIQKLRVSTLTDLGAIELVILCSAIGGLYLLEQQGILVNRGYYWWMLYLYVPLLNYLLQVSC